MCTCGTLKPDPERDPIRGVFFSIMNDVPKDHKLPCEVTGKILLIAQITGKFSSSVSF